MNWFLKRLREPSTWGGVAMLTLAAGQLGKINEAPAVAGVLESVGQSVAGGADPVTAGVLLVGGLFSALLGERGSR
jgi:hypothetical protein